VLPFAGTLTNLACWDFSPTMDAIKKQLPSRNKVSLALDGWTTTNTLAIPSVIAYNIGHNWALLEVQLTFYEVETLFVSYIAC
jgi:hypothetical protein